MAEPILNITGATKRYGRILANDNVDFQIEPGRIHAVLGENGAGKSTLMKVIYGVVKPDAGTVSWEGQARPQKRGALGLAWCFSISRSLKR